jgi:uncharacterized protein YjbI with pentapeptide repeats
MNEFELKNLEGMVLTKGAFATEHAFLRQILNAGENDRRPSYPRADFRRVSLCYQGPFTFKAIGADFGTLNLCQTVFYNCDLRQSNFSGCDMSGVRFLYCNLEDCDLTGANLNSAMFCATGLYRTKFKEAIINDVAFALPETIHRDSLRGAVLRNQSEGTSARINQRVTIALRSDGYTFALWKCDGGSFRVTAGCRNFSLREAHDHWENPHYHGTTELRRETKAILDYFDALSV